LAAGAMECLGQGAGEELGPPTSFAPLCSRGPSHDQLADLPVPAVPRRINVTRQVEIRACHPTPGKRYTLDLSASPSR
jgi:hypothetical protein